MESKRVTINVKANGKTKVETHGMVGQECTTTTAMLTDKLGQSEGRTLKPEYYAGDGGVKLKEELK